MMYSLQPEQAVLSTVWLTGGANTGACNAFEYADTSVTAICIILYSCRPLHYDASGRLF